MTVDDAIRGAIRSTIRLRHIDAIRLALRVEVLLLHLVLEQQKVAHIVLHRVRHHAEYRRRVGQVPRHRYRRHVGQDGFDRLLGDAFGRDGRIAQLDDVHDVLACADEIRMHGGEFDAIPVALFAQFRLEAFHQRQNAVLGRRVDDNVRRRMDAGHGRDANDVAATALHHVGQEGADGL